MPTAMMHAVISSSGHAARLWMNGRQYVRIMCTISVCESRPSTNQPDWNSVCSASELAPNPIHIKAWVAMSKIELIEPKDTMKFMQSLHWLAAH